jgi:NADH-quinone oxidoreductase subunit M
METLPLLTTLLLVPVVALALLWLGSARLARALALTAALLTFGIAIAAVIAFDSQQSGFQLIERWPWIPSLGIHYYVGVDGISILFLPATALLFVGVVAVSTRTSAHDARLYFSLLLALEAATLGVFCALDTMLFFLFWELALVPLFFLVSLWGVGPERRFAATKYLMVMLAGGVPLLFGFILAGLSHASSAGAVPVFDLPSLLATPMEHKTQVIVFLLLLAGFAFKIPLVPLHSWLPVVAMEGPVAVVATLTGIKLGAYGLIRLAVPLAPEAAAQFSGMLALLGVVGILYGAMAALAQTNLRSMLAYSSVSHVGLVVLGVSSLDFQGAQGAILMLLNFAIASGGILLMTDCLHRRTGSSDAAGLGGAASSMPLLASFFLLFGLAGMGLPGTSGFPGELLVFVSVIGANTGAGLAALFGMVLGAAYFLGLYRRVFLGPVTHRIVAESADLTRRERVMAGMFAVVVLGVGLYPAPWLDLVATSVHDWASRVEVLAANAPDR